MVNNNNCLPQSTTTTQRRFWVLWPTVCPTAGKERWCPETKCPQTIYHGHYLFHKWPTKCRSQILFHSMPMKLQVRIPPMVSAIFLKNLLWLTCTAWGHPLHLLFTNMDWTEKLIICCWVLWLSLSVFVVRVFWRTTMESFHNIEDSILTLTSQLS